jgi:hypothetical protein
MKALLRKRDLRPVEEEETVVDQSETVPVFSRFAGPPPSGLVFLWL